MSHVKAWWRHFICHEWRRLKPRTVFHRVAPFKRPKISSAIKNFTASRATTFVLRWKDLVTGWDCFAAAPKWICLRVGIIYWYFCPSVVYAVIFYVYHVFEVIIFADKTSRKDATETDSVPRPIDAPTGVVLPGPAVVRSWMTSGGSKMRQGSANVSACHCVVAWLLRHAANTHEHYRKQTAHQIPTSRDVTWCDVNIVSLKWYEILTRYFNTFKMETPKS